MSALKPEMATFNAGSLNFALYPVVQKVAEFKYPWEKAIRIIRELGYEPATENEARKILKLKGIDKIHY